MDALLHGMLHLVLHLRHGKAIVSMLHVQVHLVLVQLLPRNLHLLVQLFTLFVGLE